MPGLQHVRVHQLQRPSVCASSMLTVAVSPITILRPRCRREYNFKVKSISMSTFTPEEAKALEQGGNDVRTRALPRRRPAGTNSYSVCRTRQRSGWRDGTHGTSPSPIRMIRFHLACRLPSSRVRKLINVADSSMQCRCTHALGLTLERFRRLEPVST